MINDFGVGVLCGWASAWLIYGIYDIIITAIKKTSEVREK